MPSPTPSSHRADAHRADAHRADVLVIGWGLAGLVAAAEAAAAGKSVVIVDQETRENLGGQAFWSFGGLFFIDSPEQRRVGIHDSIELARQDWFDTAGFDRDDDHWPRQWAEAYLDFAHHEKRAWLREKGVGFFPVVGWPSAAATPPPGRGTRCPASTSRGARGRGSSRRSRPRSSAPKRRAG